MSTGFSLNSLETAGDGLTSPVVTPAPALNLTPAESIVSPLPEVKPGAETVLFDLGSLPLPETLSKPPVELPQPPVEGLELPTVAELNNPPSPAASEESLAGSISVVEPPSPTDVQLAAESETVPDKGKQPAVEPVVNLPLANSIMKPPVELFSEALPGIESLIGTSTSSLGAPSMDIGTSTSSLGMDTSTSSLGTGMGMGIGTSTSSLGMGTSTPSLSLGIPSLSLGTPSLSLGTSSLGTSSLSLGTPISLGTSSLDAGVIILGAASDIVIDPFANIPGGMYTDEAGVLRRNLPAVKVNVIQKSTIQNASTLTRDGFCYQECRSALQKAIRRGRPDEAVQWAYQMYYTPLQTTSAKTNLINRLLVTALEDIGPANPWAIIAVIILLKPVWDFKQDDNITIIAVLKAAMFLASPELARTRAADLLCHISNPQLISAKNGKDVSDITIRQHFGGNLETVKASLVAAIKTKNIEQMVFLTDLLFFTTLTVSGIGRGGCTKGHYLVKEAWKEALPGNLYIEQVTHLHVRLYRKPRGSCALIYANIALLHLYDKLLKAGEDWPEYLTSEGPSGLFHPDYETKMLALLTEVGATTGKPKYGIPEYALDKHTTVGIKTLKRGLAHFFGVGISPELSPSYIFKEQEDVWLATSDFLMRIVQKNCGLVV